ncbi:hypothetical protein HN873_067451, partial [Arachis hypogaea]
MSPSLTLLISATLTPSPNNAAVSLSQPVTTPPSNPSQHHQPSVPLVAHAPRRSLPLSRMAPTISTTRQRHSVSLKSLLERFDSLPLVLLETIVNNCKKAFSEVAAERVLDDMV